MCYEAVLLSVIIRHSILNTVKAPIPEFISAIIKDNS